MKKETGLVDCKVCKGAGITLSDAQILLKKFKRWGFWKIDINHSLNLISILFWNFEWAIWWNLYFELRDYDHFWTQNHSRILLNGLSTYYYVTFIFKWPPTVAFWCNVKHHGLTYSHMKLEQKIMQIDVNRAILLVSSNKWYGPWALSLKFVPLKYIRY